MNNQGPKVQRSYQL